MDVPNPLSQELLPDHPRLSRLQIQQVFQAWGRKDTSLRLLIRTEENLHYYYYYYSGKPKTPGKPFIPEIQIMAAFLLRKPGALGMTLLSHFHIYQLSIFPFSNGNQTPYPPGLEKFLKNCFAGTLGEEDLAVPLGGLEVQ